MRLYLDTSAAAKLMLDEPESEALTALCDGGDVELISTDLLETELRRLAQREGCEQAEVTARLDRISLHELTRSAYHEAGLIEGQKLRSLDALHLTGAFRLSASALLAYDRRLAEAAIILGMTVLQPGRTGAMLTPGAVSDLTAV